MFEEFTYTPEPTSSPEPEPDGENVLPNSFEIPLNTLIECLNIFGTAVGSSGSNFSGFGSNTRKGRWRTGGGGGGRNSDDDENSDDDRRGRRKNGNTNFGNGNNGRIDHYFASNEKGTGMRLTYAGVGHPLTLLLAEDSSGPTTRCEIMTLDSEDVTALDFSSEHTALKIILKSSWLRDALSELDPSCDKLSFIGNPPVQHGGAGSRSVKPMLRIQATGTFGSTEMDYPNDREVLETFECSETVTFSYRCAHITRAIKALQASTKTSLRIDDEGLLSLQFLIPSPKPKGGMLDAFIEFRCMALDQDS